MSETFFVEKSLTRLSLLISGSIGIERRVRFNNIFFCFFDGVRSVVVEEECFISFVFKE